MSGLSNESFVFVVISSVQSFLSDSFFETFFLNKIQTRRQKENTVWQLKTNNDILDLVYSKGLYHRIYRYCKKSNVQFSGI